MEKVGYYNISELVERVRTVGNEIIIRRHNSLASVSVEKAEEFISAWVRLSAGLADYQLFSEQSINRVYRSFMTGDGKKDFLQIILGTYAELRARVFNNQDDWVNFVGHLAVAYSSANDTLSVIEKQIISALHTEQAISKSIFANPWIIVIWVMSLEEVRIRKR